LRRERGNEVKLKDNMIDTGLKDKVALITGINNPYGIGAATAKAFAAEGAAKTPNLSFLYLLTVALVAQGNNLELPGVTHYRLEMEFALMDRSTFRF